MDASRSQRNGGRILVDCLLECGVERIYGVPGESFLPVLDALYDSPALRFVVARHEGGAAMMAEAEGKLCARPGVCIVTRGPGATNASAGLHVAFQDSTPMLLLIGQVGLGMQERGAFQELDYRRVFGPMAKWVAQVEDPRRIPELISRAMHTATSGRPGPVVLALPEDVLSAECVTSKTGGYQPWQARPGVEEVAAVRTALAQAQRPLLLLGEGGWDAEAAAALERFAAASELPVVCSFRCQDHFDNDHPCYIGDLGLGANPSLLQRIEQCDVLLAMGARLGEVPSQGYRLLDLPRPRQRLLHVQPDAEELAKVYQPALGVVAEPAAFAKALTAQGALDGSRWVEDTRAARADFEAWNGAGERPEAGRLNLAKTLVWMGQHLPAQTIITNGAGNYAAWVHRHYRYRAYRSQLAPLCGSMGYGLPAAIAAKLRHPERPVICFAGDGCLQMSIQELGTLLDERLAVVVVVVNNASYGTIRMHQERHYPGRVIGTGLCNPDFVAVAKGYGLHAERVTDDLQVAPALERALATQGPSLVELVTDLEAISPSTTITQLRAGRRSAS